MKKNLLKSVIGLALMTICLPIQADGVKWLEKCLAAGEVIVNKGETTKDNGILKVHGTGSQELKITLTPRESLAMTNGQTYVVVESNITFDKTKKLDHLTVNGTNLVNKSGLLVGFNKEVNGHKLTVFSILDKRGSNAGDVSAVDNILAFLYKNDQFATKEMSLYLQPNTALAGETDIEIYNIGFYSLGDILSEYTDLASESWRFTKSGLSEVESYNGNDNVRVRINNINGTSTLQYNYLRARTLSNMPSKYTVLDLRNMNIDPAETGAISKDAFDGLTFNTILLKNDQYKAFPTMNTKVANAGYRYKAYKDGVQPSSIEDVVDGGGSNGHLYSYTRNFKEGNNSCILPFDVNAEDLETLGLKTYIFDSYAEGKVNFKSAEGVIGAGTPLMIKSENAGLYLLPAAETPNLLSDISGYKETSDVQGNQFVGSFVNEVPTTYSNCYGLDNTATSFVKMGDEVHTTYYRAFLSLKDNVEAKPLTLSFDGVITGISQVNAEKVWDDAYYNLQGVKMNPNNLPHGIYIHQGKKVVK